MLHHRSAIMFAGFGFLLSISACGDNITITQARQDNRPPTILVQGADYEPGAHIRAPLPQLWVIATDPDGADDIAAVVLSISSISIVSLIVRPDDSSEVCRRPFYAPMDTINILPYLTKQVFSIPNLPLNRSGQSVYSSYLSYTLLTEGGISSHGVTFGQDVKTCRWGFDYLYMIEDFGLYPPALPTPRDVYLTYAEFSISGIRFTIYDQSGATASVTFPDFYAVFSNSMEDQTPP